MTTVPVKEALQHPAPSAATPASPRFTWRKRAFFCLLGAAAAIAVFHFVVMPWLLRNRVRDALAEAGFQNVSFTVSRATLWGAELRNVKFGNTGDGVEQAQIRYHPDDLWQGKIDALRLSGVRYTADLDAARARKTKSVTKQTEIPIRLIEVVDSQIVLAAEQEVTVPLQATLERKEAHYEVSVTAGEGAAVAAHGTVSHTLDSGSVTANVHSLSGELLSRIIRIAAGDVGVDVRGRLAGSFIGKWENDAGRVAGEIKLSDGGKASGSKLSITDGVFSGEAEFGPTTKPSLAVEITGADIATPDFSAEGVSGTIALASLAPVTTTAPQEFRVAKLTLGEMEMSSGKIEFFMEPNGHIIVRDTQWHWLGGELSASNFHVPSDGPLSVTVNLRDVELSEVLKLLAEEKASGQGKLTGQLPITIDGSSVSFGNGVLSSMRGGNVQIKDAAALAPAAQAAEQVAPAGISQEQVKRDIIEALSDFQYDRLTGRLVNEKGGLSAYVRMSGHGRKGAQQSLDYELRVHGLDAVLRSYLGIRQAMDEARSQNSGKAGT